jgi:hypothetical protein
VCCRPFVRPSDSRGSQRTGGRAESSRSHTAQWTQLIFVRSGCVLVEEYGCLGWPMIVMIDLCVLCVVVHLSVCLTVEAASQQTGRRAENRRLYTAQWKSAAFVSSSRLVLNFKIWLPGAIYDWFPVCVLSSGRPSLCPTAVT